MKASLTSRMVSFAGGISRQIASLGGDVSGFVPQQVLAAIIEKWDDMYVAAAAEARADAAQALAADAGSEAGQDGSAKAAVSAPAAQPWPPTLPEQMRAVAQLLAASPAPLPLTAIEAAFKGKGPWKKGLPRILETLEALGRAQLDGGGWRG